MLRETRQTAPASIARALIILDTRIKEAEASEREEFYNLQTKLVEELILARQKFLEELEDIDNTLIDVKEALEQPDRNNRNYSAIAIVLFTTIRDLTWNPIRERYIE